MSSPYLDLPERCVKLDRRHTRYRFDVDGDIPWSRSGEPGLYYGPGLLADLGYDTPSLGRDPAALADLQWGLALATCLEFIELERGIIDFIDAERAALGPVRSAVMLAEEEAKHIALFLRIADDLRARRPELVGPLEHAFHGSRGAPFDDPDRYPDAASYHYAFWSSTLFFEDYTIYLHERLAADADRIQPTWLAAHAMHRREEEQHVVTDSAHVDACALDAGERQRWSRLAHAWLGANVGRFLGLDAPEAMIRSVHPELPFAPRARFADTALHRDLLEHRLFRRTRAASPYLTALAAGSVAPDATESQPPRARLGGRLRGLAGRALGSVARRAREIAAGPDEAIERFDLRATRGTQVDAPAEPSPADDAPPQLETVRAIWADVLELPAARIGDDDPFTALGGDSLQAVEVHTALEAQLGRPLSAELLLECRTVREMATYLVTRESGRDAGHRPGAATGAADEPIAIVAIAARLPGATDVDALWQLLAAGRDATREVPASRWDAARFRDPDGAPGTTVCARGGFLDGIAEVDPAALGLSDRQAEAADPQQRLFLELAMDALEAAGADDGRVGVFAGSGWNEYFAELRRDPRLLGSHAALGNLDNMVAARVSQLLGLRGPALTVDAACASSHLAIHLACRSLRAGECELALAGAAQLNLGPMSFVAFSQAGVLSPTERCRPFSAEADGFVPGEGAGVVLLEPLSRARARGHQVLAVIRGSAVNNDGGALSGMAPSPGGQLEVLRAAYADAGVSPDTVDWVETHGTGTPIGDAVEVQALAQVVGGGERPCAIGSIKSNVGHCLTAAGVASVIKTVLALRHRQLPPLAGCDHPSQRIDFSRLGVRPLQRLEAWPETPGRPRRAGVTGLGIGGTNVHLVIEEAPPAAAPKASIRGAALAVVSAPSADELPRVARAYADRLATAADREAELRAINRRAGRFPCRRAVVRATPAELVAGLRVPGAIATARAAPRVALVFAGPGSQFTGMARPLYDGAPVFRAALDQCARILAGHLPRPLADYLYPEASETATELDRIDISQPAVFAVGWALAAWVRSLGLGVDAVIGHSAGEYIAACAGGGMQLEQALALVTRRGQAMSRTAPGKMAAVFATEAEVRAAAGDDDRLDLAAINAPSQVVLSGASASVDRALAALAARGISAHELPIACAAHSPLMEPARAELAPVARAGQFAPLSVPFYSAVTGAKVAPGETLGADYWIEHLRAPVRFADAVSAAAADGIDVFVEVGASGGLTPCIEAVATGEIAAVPLLRRSNADSWEAPLAALGRLVELGVSVDLARLEPGAAIAESRYPYRRRALWLAPEEASDEAAPTPALGKEPQTVASWRLEPEQETHARDHVAAGRGIAPGARLMELLLEAAGAGPEQPGALADVVNLRPLEVDRPREARAVRATDGRLTIDSRQADGGAPVVHATARVDGVVAPSAPPPVDLTAIAARCPRALAPEALYDFLATTGMTYGPTMRTVAAIAVGDGELLATLEARDDDDRWFHPAVVDGAMQAIGGFAALATADEPAERRPMFLGFSVGQLSAWRPVPRRARAHIALGAPLDAGAETVRVDVTLCDDGGEVCTRFDGVALKRVRAEAQPPPRRPGTVSTVILAGRAPALRRALEDAGVFVLAAASPADAEAARALVERAGPVDAIVAVEPIASALTTAAEAASLPLIAAPTGEAADAAAILGAGPSLPAPVTATGASAGGAVDFLRAQVAALLHLAPEAVDARAPLSRLGVDSLMALELVLRLERHYGARLYPTLLFEHPTIEAAAAALRSRFGIEDA